MIFRNIFKKVTPFTKNIHTSIVVRSDHHDTGGIYSSNFPFSVRNRFVFLAFYVVFCASGMGFPMYGLRRLILTGAN